MTLTIFHQKSLLKISLHRIENNGKAHQYSFSSKTHKECRVPFNSQCKKKKKSHYFQETFSNSSIINTSHMQIKLYSYQNENRSLNNTGKRIVIVKFHEPTVSCYTACPPKKVTFSPGCQMPCLWKC